MLEKRDETKGTKQAMSEKKGERRKREEECVGVGVIRGKILNFCLV